MNIRFDTSLKIASVAKSPWVRRGPERWLPEYAVASYYGWDLPAGQSSRLVPVTEYVDKSEWPSVKQGEMQASAVFQKMIDECLPGYDILPATMKGAVEAMPGRRILGNDYRMTAEFENKAFFRRRFSDRLEFPSFQIKPIDMMQAEESDFASLMAGRERIVLQDTELKAGKGTYIVSDLTEYRHALQSIRDQSGSDEVVISDFIRGGTEFSIQGCVCAERTYTGPLQQQIVRHPLLAKIDHADTEKFCGVQIVGADQDSAAHQQARQAAEIVGADLRAAGYRGIFGLDFMCDSDSKLYLLELNPRITGATPLLSSLCVGGQVPFLLLHLLELGGYDYGVDGDSQPRWDEGALLLIHSQNDNFAIVERLPKSGTYRFDGDRLEWRHSNIELSEAGDGEFVLQAYQPLGSHIKPGGRLVCLLYKSPVADAAGQLYETVERTVQAVHLNTSLRTA